MTEAQDSAKGYSVWLMPDGKSTVQLISNMEKLSRNFDAPSFSPHITLIGQLEFDPPEVHEKFSQLASSTSQMTLEAEEIVYRDVYFRSIVFKIEESEPLFKLNQKARHVFDRTSDPTFFPHLSLLYGNQPESEKRITVEGLFARQKYRFQITGLELVRTQGQVQDWVTVERIDLG